MKKKPLTPFLTGFTPAAAPKAKPFDWLKWLIAIYTIVTGVWCWATPFSPLAIIAFSLGMVGMVSHHRASDRVSRRAQFWLWLAAGIVQGLPMAATLWCLMVFTRVFMR